jgi:hypothetical protein
VASTVSDSTVRRLMAAACASGTRASSAPVSTSVNASALSAPPLASVPPPARKRTARHDSVCTVCDVTSPADVAV